MNKARDPHQDLIDTLSLLTLKKLISRDEADKIITEAKQRFPDGNEAYGQAVLWQLCKDSGLHPGDVPNIDFASSPLKVLRGVLVGTIMAQRFLAIARETFDTDPNEAHNNSNAAEVLLAEANGLAVAFLEAIK